MAADAITPAIIQYIDHNAYPEDETVDSANLDSTALTNLLEELRKAQDEVKNEIRTLSKNTAPDIDTWISRAKELQADIVRSRDTARQIVAEHEAGQALKAKVEDTRKKVQLLEKEVTFEETLAGTLEHIRYANGVLDASQEEAVNGNVKDSLRHLEEAEGSIGGLEGVRDTKAFELLQRRAGQLRDNLNETATEFWSYCIAVDHEERKLAVHKDGIPSHLPESVVSAISLDLIVQAAQGLGIFDGLVQKLSRDIERAVFRPRVVIDGDGLVAKLRINGSELSCAEKQNDTSCEALFDDLQQMVGFLANNLSHTITTPLSDTLLPAISLRLEEYWLEPSVPLAIEEMPAFQDMLQRIQNFAEQIDKLGWHGSKQLHDWVQSAPRTWLTKRREAVLGDVRNLVFAGLSKTSVVERVETQMVSKDDHQVLQGGSGGENGDDEWDTAWDEPEEDAQPEHTTAANEPVADNDDDGSAWDTEDMDDKPSGSDGAGDDEGDAWGWGDDDQQQKPASAVASKKAQPATEKNVNGDRSIQPQEREMTLRETFTVTAVPDGVLAIIQQIIADAQTLAGPSYANSPIAPAATALYTIPTLALAIYRATAPTAYSKLATGNMLIYNDASHLASKLRDWQANEPPASRLRLDNDVKALESFAKKAYSSEMESQRTILRDLLDGAQGFSAVTKQPYKQEAESAVEQTVDRLREVQRQWKGVLSDGALLQSLGSLLATVTGKMITEIEDLGDIGEEDSHQLRALMDKVSEAKDIFEQQREGSEAADMTFIYCPNWLKFQYLAEILESSLADIKYLWNEGELSLEFEAEEVVELIEGLFADSELRRRAVGEIRRARR
jgi:protein transport protein DSL1/ZW10